MSPFGTHPLWRGVPRAAKVSEFDASLLDALLSSTHVGIFMSDSGGACVYVNDRWCELAGMSSEQALGDGWMGALHPDDRPRVEREWAAAAAAGRDSLVSYRMLHSDGEVCWVEGHASHLSAADGRAAGWVGTCYEVGPRVAAENEASEALRLLDSLQVSAPVGFALVDRELRFVRANMALSAMIGGGGLDLVGRPVAEIATAALPELERSLRRVLERGEAVLLREVLEADASPSGEVRYLLSNLYPIRVEGEVTRVGVIVFDITEEELAKRASRVSDQRYHQLFDQVGDAVFLADLEGQLTSMNDAALLLTGYDRDELVHSSLFDLVVPDSEELVREAITTAFMRGSTERVQMKLARKDGRLVDVEVSGRILEEDGRPHGIVGIARDVSEREALQSQLRHQAFHDSLTGLPNRPLFLDRLGQALARSERSGSQLGVLILDLDDFKTLNDTHGHPAGDSLLMAIAPRLEKALRASDTAARLGGDEFACILEDMDGRFDADATARRILAAVAEPIETPAGPHKASASLGIALATNGATVDSLLRDADTAMYKAKRNGKGSFDVYNESIREALIRENAILTSLEEALERGDLNVHYQPIVSVFDNTVIGVEALARWPEGNGPVSPSEFIPLAEANGMIVPFGRYVLRQALADMARWRRENAASLPDGIFVNVSSHELARQNYARGVIEALDAEGLAPNDLTLELTERGFLDVADQALSTNLAQLSSLGIRLALDDFGTGYSGLASLKRFPLSHLKIDREFIAAIDRADAPAPVTRATVGLGKTLGMTVIAEGVETQEQLDYLRRIGCDAAQGFLLGRPQAADTISALIAAHTEPPHTAATRARPSPQRASHRTTPAVPPDEEERLEALWSYHVLDSDREPDFDAITQLAAAICETPMAFVSLVDRDREFFKAAVGSDQREAPRDTSFCGHAILEDSIFVVPDTLEDSRFATNPNVIGGPRLRFYAGVPLTTPDGHTIGELCVKDTKPRALTPQQREALEILARQVIAQLERRKLTATTLTAHADIRRLSTQLGRTSTEYQLLLDRVSDGVIAVTPDNRITHSNPTACRLLGYSQEELIGQNGHDLLHHTHADGTPYPIEDCPFTHRQQRRAEEWDNHEVLWRKDGSFFPIEYTTIQIADDHQHTGWLLLFHDVSPVHELRQS